MPHAVVKQQYQELDSYYIDRKQLLSLLSMLNQDYPSSVEVSRKLDKWIIRAPRTLNDVTGNGTWILNLANPLSRSKKKVSDVEKNSATARRARTRDIYAQAVTKMKMPSTCTKLSGLFWGQFTSTSLCLAWGRVFSRMGDKMSIRHDLAYCWFRNDGYKLFPNLHAVNISTLLLNSSS